MNAVKQQVLAETLPGALHLVGCHAWNVAGQLEEIAVADAVHQDESFSLGAVRVVYNVGWSQIGHNNSRLDDPFLK